MGRDDSTPIPPADVVDQALEMLNDTRCPVLVGAKAPVGFFGDPGKPASLPQTASATKPPSPAGDTAGTGVGPTIGVVNDTTTRARAA